MIPLFFALTCFNLLMLCIAAGLGYAVDETGRFSAAHQLAGALTAMVCCAVHCIVFTYFIATAKWVQHAIAVKQLDPSLTAPTRSFRRQAFPAALLAMASVFAAAVVGVATFNGAFATPLLHELIAWGAIAINIAVAAVEYRAIRRNGALIDRVLELIHVPQV
jgi:hypothetical protein